MGFSKVSLIPEAPNVSWFHDEFTVSPLPNRYLQYFFYKLISQIVSKQWW